MKPEGAPSAVLLAAYYGQSTVAEFLCLYLFPLKKTEPLGEGVPSGPLTIIYR